MGCSSSIPDTSRSLDEKRTSTVKTEISKTVSQHSTMTTFRKTVLTETNTVKENMTFQRKEHSAVAFAVDMDGNELQNVVGCSGTTIKLKGLEPLNVPRLTSHMLAEKQKQFDSSMDKLEEKMEKAKLHRDIKRQDLLNKQKEQTAHAKLVREKAKKCKETARFDEDTQLWG